jgi:hypothetical protein
MESPNKSVTKRSSKSSDSKHKKSGEDNDGNKGRMKNDNNDHSTSAPNRNQTASERSARCYPSQQGAGKRPCEQEFTWQNGKHVRDECGSGIVSQQFNFVNSRKYWCRTPLSMYQATHGDLGRKILCRTAHVVRDIRPAPPCNMDEYILPFCRGYYRKYECIRPCEEKYVIRERGQRIYRNSIDRYWDPCIDKAEERRQDIREIAPHNITLGKRLRRRYGTVELPCW